jgi:hypothetical protein
VRLSAPVVAVALLRDGAQTYGTFKLFFNVLVR